MKKLIFSSIATLLLIGCGSGESSSSSTKIWDYFVPNQSLTILFNKITTVNNNIDSRENDTFTHEYNIISKNEVHGSWRNAEGEYSIKLENNFLKYAPIESDPDYSWSSGSIRASVDQGDSLYSSDGSYGTSETFAGLTSSLFVSGLDCVLHKVHDNITLYPGYSYKDVLEVECQNKLDQKYGERGSIQSIQGIDRYYEYYEKNRGWIGKINKNCIVAIGDNTFEFVDDNNGSCIKTKTEYILAN